MTKSKRVQNRDVRASSPDAERKAIQVYSSEQRRTEVVRLLMEEHLTVHEAAERMDMTQASVLAEFEAAVGRLRKDREALAAAYLPVQLERYHQQMRRLMQEPAFQNAAHPDHKTVFANWLKVMERLDALSGTEMRYAPETKDESTSVVYNVTIRGDVHVTNAQPPDTGGVIDGYFIEENQDG